MKTKTLLLICLFLGIGLTQLSGQNGQNGTTGSYSEWYEASWDMPIFCPNEQGVLVQTDNLKATLWVHHKAHFLKGDWLTCYVQCSGTAVSVGFKDENGNQIGGTGEVFDIKEIDKQDNNIVNDIWNCVDNYHFNAKGRNGTHYIGTITLYCDGKVEGGQAKCF